LPAFHRDSGPESAGIPAWNQPALLPAFHRDSGPKSAGIPSGISRHSTGIPGHNPPAFHRDSGPESASIPARICRHSGPESAGIPPRFWPELLLAWDSSRIPGLKPSGILLAFCHNLGNQPGFNFWYSAGLSGNYNSSRNSALVWNYACLALNSPGIIVTIPRELH